MFFFFLKAPLFLVLQRPRRDPRQKLGAAVLPVLEGKGEVAFPLPYSAEATTYRFTRASHKHMVKAALRSERRMFFHALDDKDGGVEEGSVGVIARILATKEDDDATTVAAIAEGRGVVARDVVSSFPFPRAEVATLVDDDDEDDDDEVTGGDDDNNTPKKKKKKNPRQREAFEALRAVARLSASVESRGPSADEAAGRLGHLELKIAQQQQREFATYRRYTRTQRRERASFFLLSLVSAPSACAARCLRTTSADERFGAILDFLTPIRADLRAQAARGWLDTPPEKEHDGPPRPGDQLLYWWSPNDGWLQTTVIGPEQHDNLFKLRFHLDGETRSLRLDDGTRSRWRLVARADDAIFEL